MENSFPPLTYVNACYKFSTLNITVPNRPEKPLCNLLKVFNVYKVSMCVMPLLFIVDTTHNNELCILVLCT